MTARAPDDTAAAVAAFERVEGGMSGAVDLPAFDRTAIEAHISLLHDLAEGLDGVLILAAFEEGGMPNVRRFKIGDVANMVETIIHAVSPLFGTGAATGAVAAAVTAAATAGVAGGVTAAAGVATVAAGAVAAAA